MYRKLNSIIIFTILLSVFFASCHRQFQKENPYNLEIVSNILEYNTLVSQDSNKALVDIEKLIPGIVLDIRYATKNNFTHHKVYSSARAFVRKPVADSLLKIQNELFEKGISLKILDAYRPYSVTLRFFRIYPDTTFVAPPWLGSIHNTGCAVDVTLVDLNTGYELDMPTQFDDFTEKASHSYVDLPEKVLQNRKLLRDIMLKYGFDKYDHEWWHYNYKRYKYFKLMDLSFEELK